MKTVGVVHTVCCVYYSKIQGRAYQFLVSGVWWVQFSSDRRSMEFMSNAYNKTIVTNFGMSQPICVKRTGNLLVSEELSVAECLARTSRN